VYFAGQLSLEAYWQRLRKGRSPFSPTFDCPPRTLRRASLAGRTLSREPFLRPTSDADSHAPEVIALADELRASTEDDWQYAEAIFDYVRNGFDHCFDLPSRRGVVGTLERGFGTCNDKLNLFVALARAGGIPARYCTIGIAPGQAGVLSLTRDDQGVFGVLTAAFARFLVEEHDPRAKRIASLVLRVFSRKRRRLEARTRDDSHDPARDPIGHYIAEVRIGQNWIPADPTLSDADWVELTQRFGSPPFFLHKFVGMTITDRMESLPWQRSRAMLWFAYCGIGRGFFDQINNSVEAQRCRGRDVIAERRRATPVALEPSSYQPMPAAAEEGI